MLPASNKGPSLNFGTPDVCLTPVGPVIVPIPYPNFGAHAMAATFSPIVKAAMIPALNLASVIALTTGDEPGVAHWTVKGPGTFDMGSPIVMIEKLPGINLTSQTAGNTGNDQPGMVVAPGAPNVLYTLAPEALGACAEVGSREPGSGEEGYFAGDGGQSVSDRRGCSEARSVARFREMQGAGRSRGERVSGEALSGAGVLEGGIGYLRVRVFSLGLAGAVARHLEEWQSGEGLSAVILDLRGCPGGELLGAISLLGEFLPEGAILAIARDADGDEVVYRSRTRAPSTVPLVVLVNEGTASAAEVFVGALVHHGRALVVGSPTYGKGAAQLGDGGTVAEVLLPDGTAIEGRGVAPHVEVAANGASGAAHEAVSALTEAG